MTTFDIYVKGIEERRARERNFAVNAELARRLRERTEAETLAALLSLTLFPAELARRLRERTEAETLAALLSLTLFPAETKAEARDPSGAAYA